MPLPRWAIITIALVSVIRIFAASVIPLNIDEAYFWVWSLHPAYGYPDHPPMVAWLIWMSSFLGSSPLVVRLPFLVASTVAAIVVGRTASLLSNDRQAGGIAAILLTFVPGPNWLLGQAKPDAAFVCFWALALWFVLRIERNARWTDVAGLGLALGGALLSRTFGWALVAGIACYAVAPARRTLWKQGLFAALMIAGALYLPFVLWDAAHGWENLRFVFGQRSEIIAAPTQTPSLYFAPRFIVPAVALLLAVAFVTIPRRHMLIVWTALPLVLFLLIVSLFHVAQPYWLLGPFTSVAPDLGIAMTELRVAAWTFWIAPVGAAALAATAPILAAALPERAQAEMMRASPPAARRWFYADQYYFRSLAEKVDSMRRHSEAVVTDDYAVAAELLYNGVQNPILIGSDPRAREWHRWYGPKRTPARAIVVAHHPILGNGEVARRIGAAYALVVTGPALRVSFAGAAPETFYTLRCSRPREGVEDFDAPKSW